jgi:hypothetical protein
MFSLSRRGFFRRRVRLRSIDQLTADDFRSVARMLRTHPRSVHKIGCVSARRVDSRQRLETRWNGKELEITAEPGDWIVTTLSSGAEVMRDAEGHVNTYSIKAERFAELYEQTTGHTEFGAVFRAKGVVEALFLSGGFEIKAPWGETQRAEAGYLVLNGSEVYGNTREVFERTYEVSE